MGTVFGVINANGGIDQNSGQITTAERTGTGQYKVKFAAGTFSSAPVVVATVMASSTSDSKGTNRTLSLVEVQADQFTLAIRKAYESGTDMSDRPSSWGSIYSRRQSPEPMRICDFFRFKTFWSN